MMLNQALYDRIASGELHFTDTEHRVWAALIAKADVNNYVNLTQAKMAGLYGIYPTHFSKALKSIISKDMAVKTRDPDGRGGRLMISPHHFWKGNAEDHREGMRIYNHLAKAVRKD